MLWSHHLIMPSVQPHKNGFQDTQDKEILAEMMCDRRPFADEKARLAVEKFTVSE